MNNKFKNKITSSVVWFEAILSGFIMIAILIGFVDLVKYIKIIFNQPPGQAYDYFKNFLSHVLLLVIGLEMIIMLIRHTPNSVIEVLIFAIARKLLIYSDNMLDLVLGIVSLAGLFAIKKYLFKGKTTEKQTYIIKKTSKDKIPLNLDESQSQIG